MSSLGSRIEHPGPEILARFIQGRLDGPTMTTVERHVAVCGACCRKLERVPDDALTRLLRSSANLNPGGAI